MCPGRSRTNLSFYCTSFRYCRFGAYIQSEGWVRWWYPDAGLDSIRRFLLDCPPIFETWVGKAPPICDEWERDPPTYRHLHSKAQRTREAQGEITCLEDAIKEALCARRRETFATETKVRTLERNLAKAVTKAWLSTFWVGDGKLVPRLKKMKKKQVHMYLQYTMEGCCPGFFSSQTPL